MRPQDVGRLPGFMVLRVHLLPQLFDRGKVERPDGRRRLLRQDGRTSAEDRSKYQRQQPQGGALRRPAGGDLAAMDEHGGRPSSVRRASYSAAWARSMTRWMSRLRASNWRAM